MAKKKAAAYVRVSTLEQAKEGYSVEAQKDRLTKYVDAMGFDLFKMYVDPGHSGAKMDRPALTAMVEDIDAGLIDTVVVYRLDRLARSQKITLYLIEDVFLKNDVEFISISENFDTSTPFGRAMVGMLSVFAQLERDTIRERMLLGKYEKVKNGWWGGSSARPPLGYAKMDKELIFNPREAGIVREIFERFNNGESKNAIFLDLRERYPLRIYHTNLINDVLRNRVYVGDVGFRGEFFEGNHEPIINEEVFELAQNRLDSISSKYGRPYVRRSALLARKLVCAKCGATMVKKTVKRKNKEPYSYYVCNSKIKARPHLVRDEKCDQTNITTELADNYVLGVLKNFDYEKAIQQAKGEVPKKEDIKQQLEVIERQQERLVDLYQTGLVEFEELDERLKALQKKHEKLLQPQKRITQQKKKVIKQLTDLQGADWGKFTFEQQCAVIDTLIEKVVYDQGAMTIYTNF
ncbi:recombinase family protein [Listeria ilorinensis]|uniref:recombinase family protein n=1 Tax=Listeria ilorinensis TaxID=2867439 RepID=UPI001EF4E50F|nr:recombinase family protein [Listeria ilorinensis]